MLSLGWSEPWRMRNLSFMLKADMVIVPKSRGGGKEEGIQCFQCEFRCIKKG